MERARLHGRSRGRRATLALLVATVAAAAVSAYLGRGYLVDSWWIRQLGSPDRMTRNEAAQRLAERRCLRAVPEIVKLIAQDPEEDTTTHVTMGTARVIACGGPDANPQASTQVSYFEDTYISATPLILALWNMGEDAVPAIEKAMDPFCDKEQKDASNSLRLTITLLALRDRSTRLVSPTEP